MSATREQRRVIYEQLVGKVIADKYTITSLMGFGGMGAVYEAVQSPMNRKVALKIIPTHDPTAAARFEREAVTISKLHHPNTVTVFDYGQAGDGQLFLAMEHLQGHTLTHLIRSLGTVPYQRAVHIAEQICRSLGEAHRAGIIHRDIKPDNIFLIQVDQDPDYVKVLDFGIAKAVQGENDVDLTAEGRIVGTPKYMSPEQVLANPTDHRIDIYSLGCILLEMLTGRPPFEHQGATKLMIGHAQEPPPRFAERLTPQQLQNIPPALEGVVLRTLSKDPINRPQTTEDLRRALSEAANMPMTFTGTGPSIPTPNFQPPPNTVSNTSNATQPNIPPPQFEHHTGNFPHETGDFKQTPTTPAPPTIEPDDMYEVPPPSKTPMILGVLLIIGLIGGVGYILMNQEQAKNPETKTETKKEQPATPKEKPKTILVKLNSTPTGATVLRSGKAVGSTPMTLEFEPGDAKTTYHLRMDGHDLQPVDIDPAASETEYTIELNKIETGKVKRKKTRRKGSKKSTKKDDPPKTSDTPSTETKDPIKKDTVKKEDVTPPPVEKKKKVIPKIEKLEDPEDSKPAIKKL